ncbi:hypothetical protein GBA52_008997 [Prunus armeniaca]|nr:hypothetical protein GBA52_008997 [Prunus armeniaca]
MRTLGTSAHYTHLFGFFVVVCFLRLLFLGVVSVVFVVLFGLRRDEVDLILGLGGQLVSQFCGVHFSDHRQLVRLALKFHLLSACVAYIIHTT